MKSCTKCQHVDEIEDLCYICSQEVGNRAEHYHIDEYDALELWKAWGSLANGMTMRRAFLISDAYARACQKGWHTAAHGALKALRGAQCTL